MASATATKSCEAGAMDMTNGHSSKEKIKSKAVDSDEDWDTPLGEPYDPPPPTAAGGTRYFEKKSFSKRFFNEVRERGEVRKPGFPSVSGHGRRWIREPRGGGGGRRGGGRMEMSGSVSVVEIPRKMSSLAWSPFHNNTDPESERYHYWRHEYMLTGPPPEQPFAFEEPQTDEHLQAKTFMEELREERKLLKNVSGHGFFDCRGLHALGTMCQFCDGRRGPWARQEKNKNAKAEYSFLRYQDSIIHSRTAPSQGDDEEDDDDKNANVLQLAKKETLSGPADATIEDEDSFGVNPLDLNALCLNEKLDVKVSEKLDESDEGEKVDGMVVEKVDEKMGENSEKLDEKLFFKKLYEKVEGKEPVS